MGEEETEPLVLAPFSPGAPRHCPASRPVGHHPQPRPCLLLHPTFTLYSFLPVLPTAETCTGQDLADWGDRLRDWFQLLHENSKQNGSASSGASPASGMGAACCAGEEGGKVGRWVCTGASWLHWGAPTFFPLLPDTERLKEPKLQNKGR